MNLWYLATSVCTDNLLHDAYYLLLTPTRLDDDLVVRNTSKDKSKEIVLLVLKAEKNFLLFLFYLFKCS